MPAYFLTERDVARIRAMLEWFDRYNGSVNPRMRREPAQNDGLSPEAYVVLVPPGGIPGVGESGTGTGTGIDDPGSAECHIYQRYAATNELQDLGYTENVYNVGPAVPGDRYVIAVRTREGDLQVPQAGMSGGSGPGFLTVTDHVPNTIGNVSQLDGDLDLVVTFTQPVVGIARFVIADASLTQRGVVNTGTQSFEGDKTINGTLTVTATLSGGGHVSSDTDVTTNTYYVRSYGVIASHDAGTSVPSLDLYATVTGLVSPAAVLHFVAYVAGQNSSSYLQIGDALGTHTGFTGTGSGGDSFYGGLCVGAGASIPYTAGNSADWAGGSPPTDVKAALDRIAAAFTSNSLTLP